MDPTLINPVQTLTVHLYRIHLNTALLCIFGSPKRHLQISQPKSYGLFPNFPISATCSTDCVHLHGIMLITLGKYYALLLSANVVSFLSNPNIVFSSAPYSQHPQTGFFSSL